MSKTLIIIGLGLIATLVLGNVVEIKFHPDKIKQVPSAVKSAAQDGSAFEKVRALAIRAKRTGEQWIIRDDRQRFEISLLYVQVDSTRLLELLETEGSWDPNKLLSQAKLLTESLERVYKQSESVPVDALASLKEESQLALNNSQASLDQLKEFQTDYEDLQAQLAQTTDSLEKQIGKFDLAASQKDEGDVAGTKDSENNESSSEEPIPLKF